ncbi:hypothetical protein NM688_g8770 [Phlebia brevispora]|uniref:Uncharacterized protein n=1 Tax=Phlebia brevispora TaxID=194682 RepID=A0ACC1RNT0_9APHY|nr:hypothetical protein NM688_g8770 [Phlebia brevispora]
MDATPASPQPSYTILRIKRKRNEEPLDALVVESRRKRSRGSVNVFQFFDTVEPSVWEDEKQKHDLESRLTSLARESAKKAPHAEPPSVPTPAKPAQEAPRPRSPVEERKYTVVPSEPKESPRSAKRRRPHAPPKIHSAKDLQKPSFTMYDAVPSSTPLASAPPMAVDPEIEKFLPMLQDYLKINSIDTAAAAPPAKKAKNDEPAEEGKEDDYVWDVFLSRPANAYELTRLANNIGTVTGLPEDEMYASDSDSEAEDEDDEDSNAEDWYKNDYPDEESSDDSDSSDAFHDSSDYEDVMYDERFNRIASQSV